MNRNLKSTGQLPALALCAVLVGGCGGSASVAFDRPLVPPPTHMVDQPNTNLPFFSNSVHIFDKEAIEGSVIYVVSDQNHNQAVWSGSQKFPLNSDLTYPNLKCANLRSAIGTCVGPTAYETFVWHYRTNGPIVEMPNCITLVAAKNSDVFFDQEQTKAGENAPIYMTTIQGTHVTRTPYQIPSGMYLQPLPGACINRAGLALIRPNYYPAPDHHGGISQSSTNGFTSKFPRPSIPTVSSSTSIHSIKDTTTSGFGYFLVSTAAKPVELTLPAGADFAGPTCLGDQGITVGYVYYYDANAPTFYIYKPCYWDPQGNPHTLKLPAGASQGIARDINSSGIIVGAVYDPGNGYGAMWPSLDSPPVDVNTLMPSNFPYYVNYLYSIGNDCSMSSMCTPTGDTSSTAQIYLGLQPATTNPSP